MVLHSSKHAVACLQQQISNITGEKVKHAYFLQTRTWDGYLIANQASSTLGSSTSAQDLLRKRYLGIAGSNKLIGALEIQQVTVPGLHECTLIVNCVSCSEQQDFSDAVSMSPLQHGASLCLSLYAAEADIGLWCKQLC